MSLLVLLGFKSSQNADIFLNNPNYVPLQPSQATVSQGYTPPAPNQGLYSPGSSNPGVSPGGWVVIYVDTLPQIPPLYQPLVQLIVDTSNNNIIYNSPNIDTTTINLTTPDSTIFQNGVPPPTSNTPQSPLNNQLPFDFQPIYPDTTIQPVKFVMPPGVDPQTAPDVPQDQQPSSPFQQLDPNQYYFPGPQDQPISPGPYNPNLYYPENPSNPDFYDPVNPNAIIPWNPELPVPGEIPFEVNPNSPDQYIIPIPYPDLQRPQPISDTVDLPEIDVTAPPPGEGWEQVPGDQFENIAPRDPVYVRPLPVPGEGGGVSNLLIGNNFVIGSKGGGLGPGDYYTSFGGTSWNPFIGALSVSGASFGDGNTQSIASFGNTSILAFAGTGTFGSAGWKTQILISYNGAQTFALSNLQGFGDGATSPVHGILYNFYDAVPTTGQPAFRLALKNQALTAITYQSSYDGGNTWVTDAVTSSTTAPASWGIVPIQSYAKGIFNAATFYVGVVAADTNIYGGTTKPTLPISTVPPGWNLLFVPTLGGGSPIIAQNIPGIANTIFMVDCSGSTSPIIAIGTGAANSWSQVTLSGALQITQMQSRDPSTWVYS